MNFPSYKTVIQSLAQIGLGVGIIISLTIAIQFTTTSIFTEPEYDDFCPTYEELYQVDTEEACVELDGVWSENGKVPVSAMREPVPERIDMPVNPGSCVENGECRDTYNEMRDRVRSREFVLSFALSLAAFLVGMFALSGPTAIALIWTGVISMLFSLRYIPRDNDLFITVAAGLVAIILIIVMAKKKDKE